MTVVGGTGYQAGFAGSKFFCVPSGVDDDTNDVPRVTALEGSYPNPFSSLTTINFALAKSDDVSLTVYDIAGRRVAELVRGRLEAGWHQAPFDASRVGSGVYFYRLVAGDYVATKKLILAR